MYTTDKDGNLVGAIVSASWRRGSGVYCISLDDGGYLALSEDDVAAINAIQDRGQKEAEAGISAAHDAWERRRFLNETARELFVNLHGKYVSMMQPDESQTAWLEDVAKRAASSAARLLVELEETKKKLAVIGLDVS